GSPQRAEAIRSRDPSRIRRVLLVHLPDHDARPAQPADGADAALPHAAGDPLHPRRGCLQGNPARLAAAGLQGFVLFPQPGIVSPQPGCLEKPPARARRSQERGLDLNPMKRKILRAALRLVLLLTAGLAASARADQLPLWE